MSIALQEFAAPQTGGGGDGAVDSVFGRTGAVTAQAGDYAVADITGLQTSLDAKVAGSTGSTDNRLLRADGTNGKTVQASVVTVDDSGNCSGLGTVACGSLTVTGNIVVTGTVDGRDVNADGSKLDGIADGATANAAYTSNPAMNGTASPGASANYARGDHVHPSDTSKADKSWTVRTVTGTTDTVQSTDLGNPIVYTNAGAVAVSVPGTLPLGVYPVFVNGGSATQLTFAGSGGLTVVAPPNMTLKTRTGAAGAAVCVNVLSSTLAVLTGDVAAS